MPETRIELHKTTIKWFETKVKLLPEITAEVSDTAIQLFEIRIKLSQTTIELSTTTF